MSLKNLPAGKFGIERETLRVTEKGCLAQTPHPFEAETLSRDFCENQLEIITPVSDSIEEAMEHLHQLSKKAERELLDQGEYLWMYSNPPHFKSESEIPIANYQGSQVSKQHYRVALERRYGKKMMLYSGIHFNFSIEQDDELSVDEQNQFYMKLFKYATKYSWVFTYLTSASPVYDASFGAVTSEGYGFDGYGSMRNSPYGYWNQFVPVLDYHDLHSFCESIRSYINKGVLMSESELYMPVRIKSKGVNNLDRLEVEGIDHVELRMFDLNPLYEDGINIEDLQFAYIVMSYFATLPDFEFTREQQELAIKNHQNAARLSGDVQIGGQSVTDVLRIFFEELKLYYKEDSEILAILRNQKRKLRPGQRYAEKVFTISKVDYQETMLNWMKKRKSQCANYLGQA